jgi:hypothetical protein
MWNFNLLAATRTIERTMPYVLYRLLICLGIGLGYLFAALAGAGTLIGLSALSQNPTALGPLGAALGFAAFGFLMYKVRPYWLHGVKIPQLALLADLAKGKSLPAGKAQIDYAKQRLNQDFSNARELFELDRAIRHALAELPEYRSAPIGRPDHPQLAKLVTRIVAVLSVLNDQLILAWHFFSNADDPRRTALAGMVVHYQHFARLIKNRFYASLFEVLGFAAAFPLLLIAIEKMIADWPISLGLWPYLFAAVFSWTLKAAFFEPIAEAAMMQDFFSLAERGIDPQLERDLEQHLASFRAIRAKTAQNRVEAG